MPTVKNRATVELDRDVAAEAATILEAVPFLAVKRRQTASLLRTEGAVVPLVVIYPGIRPYAHVTAGLLASLAGDDRLGFVVGGRLPAHVRRELEAAGCAYADTAGAMHIDVPGLLLHIEPPTGRGAPSTPSPAGVGVVGVRLVQAMLAGPDRDWTVADLAREAGASTGQAHNMLVRLESEGLITAVGRGPARRRRVTSAPDLLEWLAVVPAARRIRERLAAFLYSPDPDGLVTRLSAYALDTSLRYAVTGAVGAAVLGARVITTAPPVMVRIDPEVDLHTAAERLRAEPVDGGANLVLVRDLGHLGIHASAHNGSVAVAPPVRVYLDMLGEARGEDAAALFREAVLGW